MKKILLLLAAITAWSTIQVSAFYNPNTGRWLSRDPINEPGSGLLTGRNGKFSLDAEANLYKFVANDPLNKLDADGRDTWVPYPPPGHYVSDPPPPSAQYPQGFSICQRDLQKDSSCDCPTMVGNALGGEHSYVQYFSQPEVGPPYLWGWGFSKGGLAAEAHFNPNSCTSCQKSSRSLQYGSGKGKSASSATDGDIQDCIKNSKPSQGYSTFKYNCRDWAKEAAKNCGLDCN